MPFHFDYHDDMFPATDFNQINLDWILQLAEQLKQTAESGGFDGAPGTPGTAPNGVTFFTLSDTYDDITAAIADGQLPILLVTSGTVTRVYFLNQQSATNLRFISVDPNQIYRINWSSTDSKTQWKP